MVRTINASINFEKFLFSGGKSPFRPMFDDRDFTDELASYERDAKEGMTARLNNARVVMEQCWTENPHERPDMNWVCGRLKENVSNFIFWAFIIEKACHSKFSAQHFSKNFKIFEVQKVDFKFKFIYFTLILKCLKAQ